MILAHGHHTHSTAVHMEARGPHYSLHRKKPHTNFFFFLFCIHFFSFCFVSVRLLRLLFEEDGFEFEEYFRERIRDTFCEYLFDDRFG